MLAATLPRTQADHDHQAKARAAELRRQLAQNAAAQNGLITQLEQLGGDTSPAANAMRERNTDQFTDRYNQARTLQAELDAITTAQPAADNPALLDELPYATDLLAQAPGVINALLNDLHADSDTFGNSTHAAAVG